MPLPRRLRAPSAVSRLGAVLAALALSLAAAPVQAQTLRELYDAARAIDATYLSARALAESAQYRVAQVEALARPQAALVGSATVGRFEPQHGRGGDSHSVGASVEARMPLFNRANDAVIAQARRSLEAAQAELEAAEQELILRIARSYFDVLAAQDTLTTTRTSKAAITEQLASARRNFEVGTATITDTREAQARFDLATAQEVAAEYDLRTKRAQLDQLVGRAGVAPRPPAAPFVPPPVLPPEPEAWVARSDEHPAVRRARVVLDTAVLETARARAERLPVVDAFGSVGSSRAGGSNATGAPGLGHLATVGVELRWPFYTGGRVENRISETLVLEERARQDLEARRRTVAQDTRSAFFSLQSLQAQVKALEAAEASSKLALEATQLGYRVGVRVNLDVLNAQTQLFQTQRDLAKARYDVLVAGLQLRQAAGQLGQADIDTVNALLAR